MRNKLLALRILSTAVFVLLAGSFWALSGPTWANFAVGLAAGLSIAPLVLAWQGKFNDTDDRPGS